MEENNQEKKKKRFYLTAFFFYFKVCVYIRKTAYTLKLAAKVSLTGVLRKTGHNVKTFLNRNLLSPGMLLIFFSG